MGAGAEVDPKAAADAAELAAMTRNELNDAAADAGVESPESLANKAEVVNAITDARENTGVAADEPSGGSPAAADEPAADEPEEPVERFDDDGNPIDPVTGEPIPQPTGETGLDGEPVKA